jgi:hypothetical protein
VPVAAVGVAYKAEPFSAGRVCHKTGLTKEIPPPLPPNQSPQTLSKSPDVGAFVFSSFQGGNHARNRIVATRSACCGHHRSLCFRRSLTSRSKVTRALAPAGAFLCRSEITAEVSRRDRQR